MLERPVRLSLRAPFHTALLLIAGGLLACGGGEPTGPDGGGGGGSGEQVATVELTPGADTLIALGETRQLQAVARDAQGDPVSGVGFDWSSADESVVTVDATGVVSAEGNGSAEITATAVGSGVTASAALAVIQRVEAVAVSPGTATLTTVGATEQFSATATDANSNPVENPQFVWASEDHSVATVAPDGTVTATGSGSSTITATSQDIPGHADLTVNQEIASLAFRTQPSSGVAGDAIDPAVQVEVVDASGNVVGESDIAITVSLVDPQQSGAALSGSKTVNAVNGVASFSGLWVGSAGAGYTLEASASGVSAVASDPFSITPGPASDVGFTAQPSGGVAGAPIDPAVEIHVQDAFGNTVSSASDVVTIEIASGPDGASLSGTVSTPASGGVATFGDLLLELAGDGYRLRASAVGLEGSLSEAFQISPASTSQLAFVTQPSAIEGQTPFDPAVQVAILDEFGNVVTSATDLVTLGIAARATLLGATEVNATDGVATFSDLSVDVPGEGFNLDASAAGLTGEASADFSVDLTFEEVSVGYDHACGITATNKGYCWGDNTHGQLGETFSEERLGPLPISGGYSFAQISAGESHTCGLLQAINPTLWCWGDNAFGQLGDGTNTDRGAPVQVSDPSGGAVTWAGVSAGARHTCAITTTGDAYCWGSNIEGQLGDATGSSSSSVPSPVFTAASFLEITAGGGHSCGITDDQSLLCWGYNGSGQIGDGTLTQRNSPVFVDDPPSAGPVDWIQVSAGGGYTCGIGAPSTSSTLEFCWGENGQGQVGDGTTTDRTQPAVVESPEVLTEIRAGRLHTCGISDQYELLCWGDNRSGQIGDGTTTDRTSPTRVFGTLSFEAPGAGSNHSCTLTREDGVYCWGANELGQVGDGTNVDRLTPARVIQ